MGNNEPQCHDTQGLATFVIVIETNPDSKNSIICKWKLKPSSIHIMWYPIFVQVPSQYEGSPEYSYLEEVLD